MFELKALKTRFIRLKKIKNKWKPFRLTHSF